MTQQYTRFAEDGVTIEDADMFPSVAFLILCNRICAIIVATVVLGGKALTRSKKDIDGGQRTRYELTAVASVSNTISSYFQYSALEYVSFPMQVLSKACKMIPNMLVGRCLGRKFQLYEYVMALVIPVGVVLFSLDQFYFSAEEEDGSSSFDVADISLQTLLSGQAAVGYAMILVYLVFDALTSNWQQHLFKTQNMNAFQMMLGVNVFSVVLTLGWLLFVDNTHQLDHSVMFLMNFPEAQFHVLALGLCNSVGQIFIYYTISTHGALVFTMIMTTRQVFSIVASVVMFGHKVGVVGIAGAAVVFAALSYKIYANYAKANNKDK